MAAPKANKDRTVAELNERLLELQVEEERCWQNVAALRMERAEVNLLLYQRQTKEGKK